MIAVSAQVVEAWRDVMDEASRRLERTSRASGDRIARARAANEHLRAGRNQQALEALDGDGEPSELEMTTRVLAHVRLGQGEEALVALERRLGLELETAVFQEALAPALAGKVPLGRVRATRVLAHLPMREGLGLEELRADKDPLVRLAFVIERIPFDIRYDRSFRVYGSHGADYETGRFLAFDAPLAIRVQYFSLELFGATATALSTLAEDPHMVHTLELKAARGDGWGLGGNYHEVDLGGLERAIAALNTLDVLPWKIRHSDVRPYDVMEDERRFVRTLSADIGGHPVGRQSPYDPAAPLLARFLAKHSFKAPPCPWAEIEPLLEEARRTFSPLGARACEEFARHVRGLQKL
jgi:hypothetical protein